MHIHIFRRDLRIVDNLVLKSIDKKIIPIFIFNDIQIKKNEYFGNNSFNFMLESLKELDDTLKKKSSSMMYFKGDDIDVLKSIHKIEPITSISFNLDVTPFAKQRDDSIIEWCKDKSISTILNADDYFIHPIDKLTKSDSTMYQVFTPYLNNALKHTIPTVTKKSNKFTKNNKITKSKYHCQLSSLFCIFDTNRNSTLYTMSTKILCGGRKNGLKKIKLLKNHKHYDKNRNNPSISTTQLSAYIKFGCVSIREVANEIVDLFGKKHALLSQLFWREFYLTIAYHHPRVLEGSNYLDKFKSIKWNTSEKDFDRWCRGETGYPIVDAGMKELNQTGYQHNRLRLICSNFLNRILGIDWRKGEKYYAQQLIDYDPSVNNGNWQWTASTGIDTKPYSQRLFNPWTQSKKYNRFAEYIYKWLPSLSSVLPKHLHAWNKHHHKYEVDYPEPMVDYVKARKRSLKQYNDGN